MNDILTFLQNSNLGLGLVISSVVFPLMVDYVKSRWDNANAERKRRTDEIHENKSRL
jgi:hypothetical protein